MFIDQLIIISILIIKNIHTDKQSDKYNKGNFDVEIKTDK